MTRFTIAVFLHLVGMLGLFIGYALEWIASSLLRRSTNAEQVRAWLRIYRLSLPISGPGLLLLILSGVYFASITESMKQGWLLSSLLAIVFALGKQTACGAGGHMGQGLFYGRCFCADGVFDALSRDTQRRKGAVVLRYAPVADPSGASMNRWSTYFLSILSQFRISAGT